MKISVILGEKALGTIDGSLERVGERTLILGGDGPHGLVALLGKAGETVMGPRFTLRTAASVFDDCGVSRYNGDAMQITFLSQHAP